MRISKITSEWSVMIMFLYAGTLTAQISHGGKPISKSQYKTSLPAVPVVVMPGFDVDSMLAEDLMNDANKVGPWRFGYNHFTDLGLKNSGVWYTMPNGDRIWRLGIKCKKALSVNFEFDVYVLPPGAEIFVMNDLGEFIGSFTDANDAGQHVLGVQAMQGSQIVIEYREPASALFPGRLHIAQVTHGYRDVFAYAKGLGDSGSCNNNVVCPEGAPWSDEIRAVAMITVNGSGICTGTLLNNCNEDGTPYFLTANHCLGGGVSTWVFRFNWQSPACASNQNGPTNQTVSGATLLTSSGGSDVALLQLNSTPPSSYNVFYSGWDHSGTFPTSQTAIHHPSGDIKKISFDYDAAGQATYGSAQCWRIFAWDDGTTEPGSSGSGLWDQNHHLIGQLYGGQATCSNNVNDYYGRFDVSWPLLQPFLGSCGSTLDGWDPNSPTVQLDAQLNAINGFAESICVNNIDPLITVRNGGTSTLTSFRVNWDIDGGTSASQVFNVNLTTGSTVNVAIPNIIVNEGSHVLNVWLSQPNGGTDEAPGNDASSREFTYGSNQLTLDLVLDRYGDETTWSVTQGATEIASGGPYTQQATNGEYPQSPVTICVPTGCYDLTVYDSFGDGMCCLYGNGGFILTDISSNILASGGAFTSSVVTNFCVPFICESSFPYDLDLESGFDGWVQSTTDDLDWTLNSGGTPSTGTGPSGDHSTGSGSYLFTEASTPNFPSKTAIITSRCFDLSGASSATLSFWYHMYGANMGTLNVDILTGTTVTPGVKTLTGDQGNLWQQTSVDLTPYLGADVSIRFRGITGTDFTSDMAIDDINITVSSGVKVAMKAMLEGPYSTTTGQMSDALRTLPSFPLTEPYTSLGYAHVGGGGGETIAPSILTVTGNNAIVDWVVLELRSAGDNTNIVATRSALIQRDGNIVDTDGTSDVLFNVPAANYYIAVRHRNHLGIMTAGSFALNSLGTNIDQTSTQASSFGTTPKKNVSGVFCMWMGNVVRDVNLKYTGSGNDRDPILAAIPGSVPTNTISGYRAEDCNMDGTVKYTGSANDRDPILTNIGGSVPTSIRTEQLP